MIDIDSIKQYLLGLQDHISGTLMQMDEKQTLIEDDWQREGGGRTRVMQGGDIFEQGGINFSHVFMPNFSKPIYLSSRNEKILNTVNVNDVFLKPQDGLNA